MPAASILIVDDSPESIAILGALLEKEFTVLVATSGERALELASRPPHPDLIILDVMMPGMDGYEVLQRLRALPHGRDIPVMFVTAMDSSDDEERGLALGVVDYVTKPVRPAIVRARVHTHVELKQARDRLRDRNASLEAEVAKRVREYELVQEVSIHALARLAEIRDTETGNHLRRTQEYVRELAQRLARDARYASFLTPRAVDMIAKSAPLHDIGKVGIPDYILRKPGRLTAEEFGVMKTHARLGARAIEQAERDAEFPVEFLEFAKQIALHHHENYDGTGYPDGLAGDAIPLPARLMALADVFDALISHRVYKSAVSCDQALATIVAQRGRKFHPDVVDAFLASFDEFCAIAKRHRDASVAEADAPRAHEARRGDT